MIKVGSTYYWIGEDRANVTAIPAWTSGVYTPPFHNIKCYSSTDLVSWTFVGNLLTLQPTGDLGPDWVVERPKVIYNSSNSWSVTANDAVTVAFSGAQIRLYGVKDPSHGIGAVSIDGRPETTVDFYAASRAGNQLVWTSPTLTQGEHSFRLRVTGSKNSSSSYGWVVPDRVDVIAGLASVDDAVKGTGTNQFSYSGAWQTEASDVYGSGTYQGTNSYSNTANTSVTLSFSGTQISYYAVRDSGHGIAAVSIDNGSETSVDLYAASRVGNQLSGLARRLRGAATPSRSA